jgi:hypothetical protein
VLATNISLKKGPHIKQCMVIVTSFNHCEKPSAETAEKYVKCGNLERGFTHVSKSALHSDCSLATDGV